MYLSKSQYSYILLLKSHLSTAYSPRMKPVRKGLRPLAIYTLTIIPRRSPEFQNTPGAEFGYQMVNELCSRENLEAQRG